jgi:hypothetical protein
VGGIFVAALSAELNALLGELPAIRPALLGNAVSRLVSNPPSRTIVEDQAQRGRPIATG